MPSAEITIGPALVRRLVQAQHPDLAGPLTFVSNGWDNVIYRLGDDLSVRLPRRSLAVDLIRNEQRWLPQLAARVGVPIPAPVRVGVPDAGYPWPWTITPWFDGRPATDIPVHDRGDIAVDLAQFMLGLHVPAPADAPRNPVRGVPLRTRTAAVRQRLGSGAIPYATELRAVWEELVEAPVWDGPALWLHGDPHPANVLIGRDPVDGRSRLAAVIDFGDVTSGDPATDLAAGWLIFDADARATFRAHIERHGGADPDTWARARGWALNMGTAIAAHSDDHAGMAAIGRHALEQVLLDG